MTAQILNGLRLRRIPRSLSSSSGISSPSWHSNLNLWNNRATNKKTAFLCQTFLQGTWVFQLRRATIHLLEVVYLRSRNAPAEKWTVLPSIQVVMNSPEINKHSNIPQDEKARKGRVPRGRVRYRQGVSPRENDSLLVSLTMRTISVQNASKQGKFGLSDNSLWQSFGTNHIVQLAMQPGLRIRVLYGIKQTPENFRWSSNRTPCTKRSRDQCFL